MKTRPALASFVKRGLLCSLALAVSGCCGGSDEPDQHAILTFHNKSPVFVHVLWESGSHLFVKPGIAVDLDLGGGVRTIEVVAAPGQNQPDNLLRSSINCCCTTATECAQESCGSLAVDLSQSPEALFLSYGPPPCFRPASGGGSCPYVYAKGTHGFQPQGEVLSGALFSAMRQVDHLPLPDLVPTGNKLLVRVATELPEVDVLDNVALLRITHAPDADLAVSPDGAIVAVDRGMAPTRVVDAHGADQTEKVVKTGDRAWRGKFPAGVRDHLSAWFAAPGTGPVRVVITLQNAREVEQKLNRFLGELGPGFATLLGKASRLPGFRAKVRDTLRDSGIALEVSYRQAPSKVFETVTWVPPVGSLAMRSVVVSLPGVDPKRALEVRVSALPGAWLIDEMRIASGLAPEMAITALPVIEAVDSKGGDSPLAHGKPLRQVQGEAVTLAFAAPLSPPPAGLRTSYALRVLGHYELVPSGRFAVDWGLLYDRAFVGQDALARYLRGDAPAERWKFCPKRLLGRWFGSESGSSFGLYANVCSPSEGRP